MWETVGRLLAVADPACLLCGTRGRWKPALTAVTDLKYGMEGTWDYRRCAVCGLVVLHPLPDPGRDAQDGEGYPPHYRQHCAPGPAEPVVGGGRSRLRRFARRRALAGMGYTESGPAPNGPSVLDRAVAGVSAVRVGAQWGCLLVPRAVAAGRLLDVGCGNGRFLVLMRSLGWEGSGVEPDPRSAAVAAGQGLAIVPTLGDVRRPDDGFDVVTMNHVVEHLADPVAQLRRIRALCRADGLVGLATPNWAALTRRLLGRYWYALEPPRHVVLFTARTLRAAVEAAGFRVVSSATRSVREGAVAWRLGSTYRDGRPWPRPALCAATAVGLATAPLGAGEEIELWATPDG